MKKIFFDQIEDETGKNHIVVAEFGEPYQPARGIVKRVISELNHSVETVHGIGTPLAFYSFTNLSDAEHFLRQSKELEK